MRSKIGIDKRRLVQEFRQEVPSSIHGDDAGENGAVAMLTGVAGPSATETEEDISLVEMASQSSPHIPIAGSERLWNVVEDLINGQGDVSGAMSLNLCGQLQEIF